MPSLPGDTPFGELALLAGLVPADLLHASAEWKRLARRKGLLDATPIPPKEGTR